MASLRFPDCGSIPLLPPPPHAPHQTSVLTRAVEGGEETRDIWRGRKAKGEGRKRSEERQGVKGEDAMRREVRAQMIEWLTGMQRGKQGKQEESERRDVRYE